LCLFVLSALIVLAPSRVRSLALPEDLKDPDIDRVLKNHAEDLAIPAPIAERKASSENQGFPDLTLDARFESAPGHDGIYGPGDRLVIAVVISNRGKGVSHAPRVRLEGDPLLFDLIPNKAELKDIAPGQQRTARFDSGVLPANLPTRQFQVTVKVTDLDGFSAPEAGTLAFATQPKTLEQAEALPLLEPVPQTNVGGMPHGAAVVVGIGEYNSPDAGALPFAAGDADIVAKYLVAMMGIPKDNVWVIKDRSATKSYILATIQSQMAGKGFDPVVFYFAGHGIPDPDDPNSRESCIVPYDGDFHKGYGGTLIRLNEMTRLVESCTQGQALLLLDACFSGSTEGGRTPALLASERGIAVEPRIQATKAAVFAGTSGIQPSLDFVEQKHGYFTYYLLAGMQGAADLSRNGRITLAEAFAWTREHVSVPV